MCWERGSYWLFLLSQSIVRHVFYWKTSPALIGRCRCPLCRTSPDFGAGREGRLWDSAGSCRGAEHVGNHQPFLLQTQWVQQKGCRAVPAGRCLETWLAGVWTCLPKAIGLAAGLFPLTFHEGIKKYTRYFHQSLSSWVTKPVDSHWFLWEEGLLFSCMSSLPRASVFVKLQPHLSWWPFGHHLSNFQLCYISRIYLCCLVQDVGGIFGVVDPWK